MTSSGEAKGARAAAGSATARFWARRAVWRPAAALRFAVALLTAMALFHAAQSMAEMIREGEEQLEELDPHGAPLGVAPAAAPHAKMRAQAILAARLAGLKASPPKHSIAALAAAAGPDPLLEDIVYWRSARYGEIADWAKARDFLNRRASWPRLGRLRAAVEAKLPETLSTQERIAFFAEQPPRTARGARLLGEALIEIGRQDEGAAEIARGWRRLPGSLEEERLYLKHHEALLAPHHEARFETLLWRDQLTAARRLAKRMPEGWEALAKAVTALHRSSPGVDAAIERVPEALADHPALAYGRMTWRERKRRREGAEEVMREADEAAALGAPSVWADERMRFARDAFEDGRAEDAARMAAAHQLDAGLDFADLEWFAGWMRLEALEQPREALDHFARLFAGVSTPISRARAAYWAGQAVDALDAPEQASAWRLRGAALPSAFYGQLCAEVEARRPRLKDAPSTRAPFDPSAFDAAERALLEAADLLYRAEWRGEARAFMRAIAARREDGASLGWLARRASAARDHRTEIEIAKRAFEVGAPLWSSLFPIPRAPRFGGRRVEPALLLAVARQESRFAFGARSGAGARGLMQVMPGTAKVAAKRLSLPYDADRLSADPTYNLALADAHLAKVLENFGGSYVLAVAAYNAGGGNVSKWIKRFGDPRDEDVDPIRWIESIPFSETRNYVQRVLEAAQIYRMRVGDAEDLQLTSDLAR